MRYCWMALAALCFALGLAGVVLPLLPTTPLMLAAVALASKGSPRFAGWIRRHRIAGPAIRSWERERAIAPRAKRVAALALALSAALVWFALDALWLRLLICLLLVAIGAWIVTRPVPSSSV
ncbi:YbaN family protein [Kushneria aurantia]|uniref:Inner membrane protein n=1 Tax=Kushneria aurantia TaxID=504092 RepID=A0ABV6G2T9_9GAMM|nr:YbaN family protein [Kushneria aurantia]